MIGTVITEALAELRTLGKRIEAKQAFIRGHISRKENREDPLKTDGGSVEVIRRERQAVADLMQRIVKLRIAIQEANSGMTVTIGGSSKTIAEWIVWKREVAPLQSALIDDLIQGVRQARAEVARSGGLVQSPDNSKELKELRPTDVVINVSELALVKEMEEHSIVLSELDGKLSLINATTPVKI